MRVLLLIVSKVVAVMIFFASTVQAFQIYRTGSSMDVQPATQPMTCLAGGGSDDEWSEGWKHMLLKANGGDIVIIRADGDRGGYEDWIFNDTDHHGFPKVNSVNTLVLDKEDDGKQIEVINLIKNAEMIFFAGGDQSVYFRLIKGTPMQAVLNQAMRVKQIPFGGTSAGMAILGDTDFRARYDVPSRPDSMITAADVMRDPTAKFVDIDRGFITATFLERVVTDTHFSQRERQGRLVGFMAKAVYNNYGDIEALNIRGIGADEGTAVCYGKSGKARVFGTNSAYFLSGNSPIERIQPGSSLDWFGQHQAVKVYAIHGTQSGTIGFDLKNWTGSGGQEKFWYVDGSNAEKPVFGER